MRSALTSLFFILSIYIYAHPGIGLIYDGDQTIYYTDLAQVWRLNIISGEKDIAVADVHTHELFLDSTGALYGEHYWYDKSEQVFKHRIWKLDTQGRVTQLGEVKNGENTEFGFVRDRDFRMYQILYENGTHIITRSDSTAQISLHKGEFKDPRWPYLSEDASLYFTDKDILFRLGDGGIEPLASGLISSRIPFAIQDKKHSLFGIWTDQDKNVYVAVYRGRVVRRIEEGGLVNTPIKTDFFWSPLNGVFDKNGDLWLLEGSLIGQVRTRKVDPDTMLDEASFAVENIVLLLLLIATIVGFRLLWQLKNKKA